MQDSAEQTYTLSNTMLLCLMWCVDHCHTARKSQATLLGDGTAIRKWHHFTCILMLREHAFTIIPAEMNMFSCIQANMTYWLCYMSCTGLSYMNKLQQA